MSGRWRFSEGEPHGTEMDVASGGTDLATQEGLDDGAGASSIRPTDIVTFPVRRPRRPGEIRIDSDGRQVRVLPTSEPARPVSIQTVKSSHGVGTLMGDVGGHMSPTRRSS